MHISRAPSPQCLDRRVTTVLQATALLVLAVSGIQSARAAEVYGGLGFPGVMVGYAHPLSDRATLRADYATLGTRSDTTTEEGITYNTKIKASRLGLFADWFVSPGSSFRLTGGLTSNQYKVDLSGGGTGSTITIGGSTYALAAGDRFDVKVKFPSTTPYLGVGWGHQKADKGWGFHADVGGSIGKAKVTTTVSGALAAQVSQADIDAETAEIRDGVGQIRFVPQLTVGVSYRF
ncbi:MAG: hypothetical protein V4739_10780 [Pseudomonadota bacterium]